jgi:ATP-dependent Clp protease protease subunit
MIHQPSGGFQGQATDIEIQAKEILELKARMNRIYADHTGQDIDTIEKAMDRDNFMTAEKAKDFGLIDEVVQKRIVEEDDDDDGGSADKGDDDAK